MQASQIGLMIARDSADSLPLVGKIGWCLVHGSLRIVASRGGQH
jgi:hypothetical protein